MTEPDSPEEEFLKAFSSLESELREALASAPREFPPDTLLRDLPDDLTPAESLLLFGTEYDESTAKLRSLLEHIAPAGRFKVLLDHEEQLLQPVIPYDEDATVESVRPRGIIVDLVLIGLMAHDILSNIDIGGAVGQFPEDTGKPVKAAVLRLSDLLNGKGPFGGALGMDNKNDL